MSDEIEIIEAEIVPSRKAASRFVILTRYGPSYWSALDVCDTAEIAQERVLTAMQRQGHNITAWRIVCARGLPIAVPEGEA